MKKNLNQKCPLYPEMDCPRGAKAAIECSVRVNGEYDPVHDFRDMLVMHCALQRMKESQNPINTAN